MSLTARLQLEAANSLVPQEAASLTVMYSNCEEGALEIKVVYHVHHQVPFLKSLAFQKCIIIRPSTQEAELEGPKF